MLERVWIAWYRSRIFVENVRKVFQVMVFKLQQQIQGYKVPMNCLELDLRRFFEISVMGSGRCLVKIVLIASEKSGFKELGGGRGPDTGLMACNCWKSDISRDWNKHIWKKNGEKMTLYKTKTRDLNRAANQFFSRTYFVVVFWCFLFF